MLGLKISTVFLLIVVFEFNMDAQVANKNKRSIPLTYPTTFDIFSAKDSTNDLISPIHLSNIKKLPLFCDIEKKLELSSGIPIKFRLGNLDYVKKLEGKLK